MPRTEYYEPSPYSAMLSRFATTRTDRQYPDTTTFKIDETISLEVQGLHLVTMTTGDTDFSTHERIKSLKVYSRNTLCKVLEHQLMDPGISSSFANLGSIQEHGLGVDHYSNYLNLYVNCTCRFDEIKDG